MLFQGATPVTLAEFTLTSSSGQTWYDISLVDGYNIPMAILFLAPSSGPLADIPPNLTNPACIGTGALLGSADSPADRAAGGDASFPLPLERRNTADDVRRWCPWDLQLRPPLKPGDGVYPYPDDAIARPEFDPCFSACARWNEPQDCCTGSYNDPDVCKPSLYSERAKGVCPDAYSFGKSWIHQPNDESSSALISLFRAHFPFPCTFSHLPLPFTPLLPCISCRPLPRFPIMARPNPSPPSHP